MMTLLLLLFEKMGKLTMDQSIYIPVGNPFPCGHTYPPRAVKESTNTKAVKESTNRKDNPPIPVWTTYAYQTS